MSIRQHGYQVRNSHGYPASDADFNDLCIFGSKPEADVWIEHLEDIAKGLGEQDTYSIHRVILHFKD